MSGQSASGTGPTELQAFPRVLVVDDLPENIEILQRLLTPRGYIVDAASSGNEALEKAFASIPDIILLDLVMPDIDGIEICKRLKADAKTRYIPIVILTGVAEREYYAEALEAGADDYLTKPLDSVLLQARVRNCLRSKRLQDSLLDYQRTLEQYNATLEARVQERTEQVRKGQQVTVFSLSRLAESRDPETGEHLERMRNYVKALAEELSRIQEFRTVVNERFIEELFSSSPLHDIGKVGIPDRILLKPGKLSPEEFEIMKLHSRVGGETLRAADREAGQHSFLGMACAIALHHHEKWDGSGYPDGLRGLEIPLEARIVALGDVYDALRSKRPYKEPFTHERAREIILAGRNTHFDTNVVDAFTRCENQFIRIANEWQDRDELPLLHRLVQSLEEFDARAGVPPTQ
jgi:putative two-component system response regulator